MIDIEQVQIRYTPENPPSAECLELLDQMETEGDNCQQ